MTRKSGGVRNSGALKILASALALLLVSANLAVVTMTLGSAPAAADTQPVDPTLPETVSAAALPTVQINGVVWNQVIVGNRVYATGQFSQARPPGAAPGTNQTPRSNILAYDLTTGALITTWAPTLNAQGMEIAASADGSTIYVSGDFTQVNGQTRNRIAALNAQTGALLPFNPGANSRVDALALNGNTIYFGGSFTTAGTNASGIVARSRLAAANATTGAVLPWAPAADRHVDTMVYHPGTGRVIVGGRFDNLNGTQQWGMGSLDDITGAVQPWAANTVIENHGEAASISALTTDGEHVFGVGWAYFGGGATANFEGTFSADPATGELDWIDGGRGDLYDTAVTSDMVYVAGHMHDWGMLDFNPQYDPYKLQYALAIDKRRSPTLTNAFGTSSIWVFDGMPAAQPLHWLPSFSIGSYTGLGQATWSVESNGDYAVFGGEFPRVNGTNQQGLVRFAKRTVNPAVDQIQGYNELRPVVTPLDAGTVRVGWTAAWDRDNQRLTVQVLRGATTASSTVLKTFQTDSNWWNRPLLGFVDATAPPGSNQTYRIRVIDPFGNTLVGPATTAAIPTGTTPAASSYDASVKADNPDWQWRMGEASGTTAYDRAGSNDVTLNAANIRNVGGALLNETDPATSFPGTTSTGTVQGVSTYWQPGPQTFSLEAWVRTATTDGGKILGFGERNDGRSPSNGNDRHLYMNNAGQIYFGVRPDMAARITINSPDSYNDNEWHHIVGTLGSDGMKLYVDGNLVSSNGAVTKAQVFRGYWRVGGDRLSFWPSTPAREAITADLDEIAVYPQVLSVNQIRAHFLASGRTGTFPNTPPTASFTHTTEFLTASFDGSGSSDDGTITSYDWDFGDGNTGTGVAPDHTYATAGTYTVTLTVTDNQSGTGTTTDSVTVTDPPPNVPPTASFTSTTQFLSASFTSTSTDSDGTIESYAWDFGDGNTATTANPQHTYAAAGPYTVTLTVTDDDGDTDTASSTVTVTDPPPEFALDAFGRTVANGLGIADVGGPWTISGTASAFSVSGDAGRIGGAVSANRAAYLNGVQQTNVDITTDLSINTAATGGGAYASVVGRRVSNNNEYRLIVRYLAGGGVQASLARVVGGVQTVLSSTTVPGLTVAPGEVLRARFVVDGTSPATLTAKVWRASDAEPVTWLLTSTDSTAALQTPGGVGYLLYVSGSWVGTAPVLTIDNLSVVAPG